VKKLHIFRPGKHTASCGTSLQFGEAELQATAAAYDPAIHEAPLVVGHPSDNGPAYGWVQGLSFADGQLDADPHQVNADFDELVKTGAYKKLSASFYAPDSPTNPVPGTWYLRHVGFLGAQPPAIKGLQAIGFAEDEPGIVEFSSADTNNWATANFMRDLREWMIGKFGKADADEVVPGYLVEEMEAQMRNPTPESSPETAPAALIEPAYTEDKTQQDSPAMTPEELAAAQAALDAREASFAERELVIAATEQALAMSSISDRIAGLVDQGRVLPAEVDQLASFMGALDKGQVVEFTEDGKDHKELAADYLVGLLAKMPKRVDFTEHSKGQAADDEEVNPVILGQRGAAYRDKKQAEGIQMSYSEAVNACKNGLDRA
jgi:hypothetical protein